MVKMHPIKETLHDIFSESNQDADFDQEGYDYGCCGDNQPLPQFTEDGEVIEGDITLA